MTQDVRQVIYETDMRRVRHDMWHETWDKETHTHTHTHTHTNNCVCSLRHWRSIDIVSL